MALHSDRVRAIGIFKARREFTPEEINENAPQVIDHVRNLPIIKSNITKYEVVRILVRQRGRSSFTDLCCLCMYRRTKLRSSPRPSPAHSG
jgi:hypothetical protein